MTNKQEQLFPEMTPEQRVEALAQSAFRTTDETVVRALSPEQRRSFKDRMLTIQTRNQDIDKAIKAHNKPLKDEQKDIKAETNDIVNTMRKGKVESDERVFLFQ